MHVRFTASHISLRFFCFGLLFAAFAWVTPSTHAQVQPADVAVEVVGDLPEAAAEPVQSAVAGELGRKFFQVLNLVYQDKFAEAADGLAELKARSMGLGYVNLPDYSFELLNRAGSYAEKGRREEAIFLINHAARLSPQDAQVNLIASSFYSVLGAGQALSYFVDSFRYLLRQPVLLATVALNVCLVGLLALTIAAFFCCILQISRNGELIFNFFANRGPRGSRGLIALACAGALFIGPIFGGIIVAIACWGIALSRICKSCRWVGPAVGMLVLGWAFGLPLIGKIGFNVTYEANRVVEDINNFSFTPKGEDYVRRQLELTPDDPLLLFALGEILQLKGSYAAALATYTQVLDRTGSRDPLNVASQMNIGAAALRMKDFARAKDVYSALESEGHTSFELFYNLALTHLGLLDTELTRQYFIKARELDESRVAALEAVSGEAQQPVMSVVPFSFYLPMLLRPVELSSPQNAAKRSAKERLVLASLFPWGSSLVLLAIAGACMLSAVRGKPRVTAGGESLRNSSVLWGAVPAGLYLAGERPVRGAIALAILLGLLIFALEAPISVYTVLPLQVSFYKVFIAAAICWFLTILLLSLLTRPRQAVNS